MRLRFFSIWQPSSILQVPIVHQESLGWLLAQHFFALAPDMQRKRKRARMTRGKGKLAVCRLTAERAIIKV